ncbi:methionine--tRNA ligase, cytoplasmic-like [Corticium candelabrum]|uniref:methionine--tRNA ligase, cytoplasmic-like n=1 Tax=Corticium candelabrum TaxID=121492 RepID=UPI002E2727DC|nr:methionine--tRNA ligase, cytoplasmic-like [Corticium candelabrum]
MKLYVEPGDSSSLKCLAVVAVCDVHMEVIGVRQREAGNVLPYLERATFPILEYKPGELYLTANHICMLLWDVSGRKPTTQDEEWSSWEKNKLQLVVSGREDRLQDCLLQLDQQLQTQSYLTQDSLSVADLIVWSSLYVLLEADVSVFGDWALKYCHLHTWWEGLSSVETLQFAVRTFNSLNVGSLKSPSLSATSSEGDVTSHVTTEDIAAAVTAWNAGIGDVPLAAERKHPILPVKGKRNILITSALPYVNNVPHLGNIIGCVLSADTFSRYCRLRNYNSCYICGTDEYGTATETKAIEEGVTPQQICDKYFRIHKTIYEWFNIDFDSFGRTTTEMQTRIAQDIFWRLHERDYLLKESVDQLLCSKCDRFLADRFVEGICPLCAYEDARGDQCDKCGKLINATELISPRCKLCSSQPVVKSSDHLFLNLTKLDPALRQWSEKSISEGHWSGNARFITRSWIRDGVKPRCITRDLKWGTPVPLEGYKEKVFYVWFDAPIGYLSIAANYTDQWEQWWKNPQNVQLYQFMAKDNVPFHSVIFPCSLIGADDNYTLVNHLSSTEYLNYEDGKFSKSRGIGVFGDGAMKTDISADVWRFYLLYIRPEKQDSQFSWSDFVLKHNTDLLNNLGNFINRALSFCQKFFDSTVQPMNLNDVDCNLVARVNSQLHSYCDNLEHVRLRDGLRIVLAISRLGNGYIQDNKPWELVKGSDDDRSRAGCVIGVAVNLSWLLAVLIEPYMPSISRTIQEQLQAPPSRTVIPPHFVPCLVPGHKIGTPSPLFKKIEPEHAEELKLKFGGKQVTSQATISAANAEDAKKLEAEVEAQGTKVRQLKANKADKAAIDDEVKKLLSLKQRLAKAKGEETLSSGGKKSQGKKVGGKKTATNKKTN